MDTFVSFVRIENKSTLANSITQPLHFLRAQRCPGPLIGPETTMVVVWNGTHSTKLGTPNAAPRPESTSFFFS